MKKYNINEGIIQVPPQLIDDVIDEMFLVMARYVYDLIPDRSVFDQFTYDGNPLPIPSDEFRIIGLDNDQYWATEIPFDESLIKYTTSTEKSIFKVYVGVKYKKGMKGAYSPKHNAIILTIPEFLHNIKDEFFYMDDTYFDNPLDERKSLVSGLMESPSEVEKAIKDQLVSLKPTIEHELAHMIQFQYLKDKSPEQVGGGKDSADEYYSGQVEFSPQIISSLRDYEIYINKIDHLDNKQYRIDILKFLFAMTEKSVYYYEDYTGENPKVSEHSYFHSLIRGNRAFFEVLKRKNVSQYKKAVKYMTNELQRKGIL